MQKASNNQIKLLRKLGKKKYREKEQLFLVEGERAAEQVITNGMVNVTAVFAEESFTLPFETSLPCFTLDKELFAEITDTDNPQGVVALCEIPAETSVSALREQDGLIILTDAIQDPGNLGTMIRTASWFGAKALILGKGSVDVYNPKVVRSTAGATGSLPVLSGEADPLLTELESSGWKILLLDGSPGAVPIQTLSAHKKTVLVVGNEANGISDSLFGPERTRVLIPAAPGQRTVESLNAAIALGIALWAVHN